ncbi:hypothetical protein [Streptomyces zingiberis]|uniref:Lipoprotein n=1 Tax=Streptomyces zingiberis TaxID=2053010 RepID=A0ABX1BTC9_9ACTN|nr:hypothetical protein [Streptomyces zingiberis]NJP99712.1 hypothetical protein [Streptomyces zingiberis]
MRPIGRHTAVGAVIALLVTGAAGCAQARPAASGRAPATAELSDAALDLAVRAGPYREEQLSLQQAEYELTRRCMDERGFDYPTWEGGTTGIDDSWQPDLENRRSHGYGFAGPAASPENQYPSGLSATERKAYARALSGDPGKQAVLRLSSGPEFTFGTTGCIAESRIGLYGDAVDAARVFYVPQEARNALNGPIGSSPAMRAATRAWKSCMKDRGQPYGSMAEARADAHRAHEAADADTARRTEVRIAMADGACALAADMPEVADRVGREQAGGLTSRQRTDLNRAAELRAAALERAQDIAGDRP